MEFGIERPEFGITKGQNLNREARSAAQTSPARRAVGASLHPYNGFRRRLRILVHAEEVLVLLVRIRSEVNIELNFPPKLRGARSRLHRRRFLQVNTRWKALAEIYTMHSLAVFAPFSNLNFFVKNRQNFFAIEFMNTSIH